MEEKTNCIKNNEEQEIVMKEELGNIKISEEVIATIAGIVTAKTKGVAGMSSGIIADFLTGSKKNLTKGVKVDIKENSVICDLYIVIEYGCKIPEVSWEIQEKVKGTIEEMSGMKVARVNIHIQGVNIENELRKDGNKKDCKTAKAVEG